MNQQQLKNIYMAFGSAPFRYMGQLVYIAQDQETGEYKIIPKQ